jgi:integrase
MTSEKLKLTKRTVEGVTPPSSGYIVVHDSEISGFQVRVYPTGKKTYFLYFRHEGQEHRKKIGEHGAVTADIARSIAIQWRGDLARGLNPGQDKVRSSAPSLDELFNAFITWSETRHKERTKEQNRYLYQRALGPILGHKRIDAITRSDVERLHSALSATPTKANQALTLLKTMLNKAAQWELMSTKSNPCGGIKKFVEGRHERFLNPNEFTRLHSTLDMFERDGLAPQSAIAALRLLIHTGCRRGEILDLVWDEVDLINKQLVLADSKTGRKRIPISDAAVEVLQQLSKSSTSGFVIKGTRPGGKLQGIEKIWQRVRRAAALEEVRLHDLRHSFASAAIRQGIPLSTVGALLGHKDLTTTQRYAHHAEDQLREALNLLGSATRGKDD